MNPQRIGTEKTTSIDPGTDWNRKSNQHGPAADWNRKSNRYGPRCGLEQEKQPTEKAAAHGRFQIAEYYEKAANSDTILFGSFLLDL